MKQHQASLDIAFIVESLDTGLEIAEQSRRLVKEEKLEKAKIEAEAEEKAEAKQSLPRSHYNRNRNLWTRIGYVQPSRETIARRVKHVSSLMQRI